MVEQVEGLEYYQSWYLIVEEILRFLTFLTGLLCYEVLYYQF